MSNAETASNAVELATELTIAWLSNPNTRAHASEVPEFLRTMHEAVNSLSVGVEDGEGANESSTGAVPAVTVRKSLSSQDHIISLIDGKPYKSLKRHLSRHGFTPDQYRARYGLKADYPMVAPSYAQRRRELAKAIGLGRKRTETSSETSVAPTRKRKARSAKSES